MLAPSLWSWWFTMGPAPNRRCQLNFSIPTVLSPYNPWDREFWTPSIYIYIHIITHVRLVQTNSSEIFQLAATARLLTGSLLVAWCFCKAVSQQSFTIWQKKHWLHLLLVNKPLETFNKILPSFFGNKIFIFSVLDLTQRGSSSDEAPGFQSYSWAGCKLISKLYAKQMPGTLKKFSKDCHGSFLKLEWVTCTNWQSFRVGFHTHTHTNQPSKVS